MKYPFFAVNLMMDVEIINNSENDATIQTFKCKLHVDIACLLIQYGANVNAKDEWLQNPLHHAFFYKRNEFELLKMLMRNGANFNLKDKEGKSTMEYALEQKDNEYFKVMLYKQ